MARVGSSLDSLSQLGRIHFLIPASLLFGSGGHSTIGVLRRRHGVVPAVLDDEGDRAEGHVGGVVGVLHQGVHLLDSPLCLDVLCH